MSGSVPALGGLAAEGRGEQDEDGHDDPADGHDPLSHGGTPAGHAGCCIGTRPVGSARSLIAAVSVGGSAYLPVISAPSAAYIDGW